MCRFLLSAIGITLTFLAPLCALGPMARAEQASPLEGTFHLVDGDPASIHRAIDAVVDDVNPFVRPIARRRLRHQNRAFQAVRIRLDGDRIVTRLGGAPPVASPADGGAVWYQVPEGNRVRVRQKVRGRVLVQHYRGEDGERINRFVLASDGRLDYRVEVRSDYLPRSVRYRLRYRRAAP